MANEDFIRNLANNNQKSTPRDIGEVLVARGLAGNVPSGDTLARRVLKDMESRGELKTEKHGAKTVFMLPHLTGYSEHDEIITDALVEIGKRYDFKALREHYLSLLGMRPDLMVAVRNGQKSCVLVIEAINNETEQYFKGKAEKWHTWNQARDVISEAIGMDVPFFHLVTHGKKIGDTLTLTEALQLMEEENGTISQ